MELECVRCAEPTAMHCSNASCVWTVCLKPGCSTIYSPMGVIPTWDRYQREQKLKGKR